MSNLLDTYRGAELDLAGLVAAAGRILDSAAPTVADGRVSAVPDARTVRYYQTVGLVDRPLRYEGRQAVYGFRHLLAVVAVKLLQARGLTLAQVQRALAAATPAQVEAAVADALGSAPVARPPGSRLDSEPPTPELALPDGATPTAPRVSTPSAPLPRGLISAEVAPGIHVTIDPARVGDPRAVIEQIARTLNP